MSELWDDGRTPPSRQAKDSGGNYRNKPKAGDVRECRACGQMLVFCRTKDGKLAPIEETIKYGGNVLVFKGSDGLVECRTFPEGPALDGVREQAIGLRFNHFATCVRADEFKRKRKANV